MAFKDLLRKRNKQVPRNVGDPRLSNLVHSLNGDISGRLPQKRIVLNQNTRVTEECNSWKYEGTALIVSKTYYLTDHLM